jgi:endo-beta-N-acetylglucosaminidase D
MMSNKNYEQTKIVLSTQSVIQSLSYDENTEDIVLTVNSSLKEWNFCFMQIAKNKSDDMFANIIVKSDLLQNQCTM